MPRPGRDYQLQEVVGQGAFGVVRRATHKPTNAACVLKRVKLAPTVLDELHTMRKLNHPHCCKLLDAWEANGALVIVMPYYPNGDLLARYNRQPALTDADVHSIAAQLALALQYIHSQKMLHRDIKPSNVLLAADGSCRLADFGLARDLASTAALASTSCGSPCYMAPELWREEPYGRAADVWSLGCTVHECVARAPPFVAQSVPRLAALVLSGRLANPLPRTTEPSLASLIQSMLAVRPSARPLASALVCSSALQPALVNLGRARPVQRLAAAPPTISQNSAAADLLGATWRRRRERRRAARIREQQGAIVSADQPAAAAPEPRQDPPLKMAPTAAEVVHSPPHQATSPQSDAAVVRRRERRRLAAQRKREEVSAYLAATKERVAPRVEAGDEQATRRAVVAGRAA